MDTVRPLEYTPIESFSPTRDELRKTFRSGKLRSLDYRKQQLAQLAYMLQDNADAFKQAIRADMGRAAFETSLAELGPVVQACSRAITNLEQWAAEEKPTKVDPFHEHWDLKIVKSARGVVLIIAPWNYPLVLSFGLLVGAIASGCAAVIKMSEISRNFSALAAELFPKYMDPAAYRIVNGSVQETTALLELQWDYIFYTGNGRVGRIVATAAAKHLTPTTLELGSKCPVIIDTSFDMKLAAKRIAWGKVQAAGQVCVAPDYVIVERNRYEEFITSFKEVLASFYPDGSASSDSYSRIINEQHFRRVTSLLEKTKGTVALGGKTDSSTLHVEPTLVTNVKRDDILFEDEIFGPILPVVSVDSLDEAIDWVNDLPNPLTVYFFSEDAALKKKVTEQTLSGQVVFNDTFGQLGVYELPFGGVGESGYGSQLGKYIFDGFTLNRGSVDIPPAAEQFMGIRYPPYSEQALSFIDQGHKAPIPFDCPGRPSRSSCTDPCTD